MPRSQIIVHKATGDWQYFSAPKLKHFLQRIGVPDDKIKSIIAQVRQKFANDTSTKQITAHVTAELLKLPHGKTYAARYNLKEALRKFGPDGHNFELYVGRLFEAQGYKVKVAVIEEGECVEHEVDVVAYNDHERNLVECKFHNSEGTRSDVVVALYTQARFADIHQHQSAHFAREVGWLATNTKVTLEAWKYIKCKGLRLLSVENPPGDSIMDRVQDAKLLPISCSTHLDAYLPILMAEKLVLISDILDLNVDKGINLGIPSNVLLAAQAEAREILAVEKA